MFDDKSTAANLWQQVNCSNRFVHLHGNLATTLVEAEIVAASNSSAATFDAASVSVGKSLEEHTIRRAVALVGGRVRFRSHHFGGNYSAAALRWQVSSGISSRRQPCISSVAVAVRKKLLVAAPRQKLSSSMCQATRSDSSNYFDSKCAPAAFHRSTCLTASHRRQSFGGKSIEAVC